jgi:hypothetical protein
VRGFSQESYSARLRWRRIRIRSARRRNARGTWAMEWPSNRGALTGSERSARPTSRTASSQWDGFVTTRYSRQRTRAKLLARFSCRRRAGGSAGLPKVLSMAAKADRERRLLWASPSRRGSSQCADWSRQIARWPGADPIGRGTSRYRPSTLSDPAGEDRRMIIVSDLRPPVSVPTSGRNSQYRRPGCRPRPDDVEARSSLRHVRERHRAAVESSALSHPVLSSMLNPWFTASAGPLSCRTPAIPSPDPRTSRGRRRQHPRRCIPALIVPVDAIDGR